MLHDLLMALLATSAQPPVGGPANYPDEARDTGRSGRVGILLEVSDKGKVTGCSVVESSGTPSLDVGACTMAKANLRIAPARDADGKAIASTLRTSVTYELPSNDVKP